MNLSSSLSLSSIHVKIFYFQMKRIKMIKYLNFPYKFSDHLSMNLQKIEK